MKRLISCLMAFAVIACMAAPSVFAKEQDLIKMNTNIDISSDMTVNEVVAIGGDVTVFGKVQGSVVAVGGSVILKPKSYVAQQVVVVGGDIIKDPSAQVAGRITQIYMPHFIPSFTTFLKGGWITLWATISMLALFGFLGLAILLVALLPEQIGTAVNALESSFLIMVLWGILWIILIVPVAVLLAVSIIGVVLIPVEMLLIVIALILGYISSAIFIGKNILLAFSKVSPPFVDAILGIIILFVVGFLPVIGPAIKAFFLVAGFGAVLTTRFGTIK